MSREQEINKKRIEMNWIKIKRINDILKKAEQVINNFKKGVKNK